MQKLLDNKKKIKININKVNFFLSFKLSSHQRKLG